MRLLKVVFSTHGLALPVFYKYGLTYSRLISASADLCIHDVVPPSDVQYTSEAPLIQNVRTRQICLGWSTTFSECTAAKLLGVMWAKFVINILTDKYSNRQEISCFLKHVYISILRTIPVFDFVFMLQNSGDGSFLLVLEPRAGGGVVKLVQGTLFPELYLQSK